MSPCWFPKPEFHKWFLNLRRCCPHVMDFTAKEILPDERWLVESTSNPSRSRNQVEIFEFSTDFFFLFLFFFLFKTASKSAFPRELYFFICEGSPKFLWHFDIETTSKRRQSDKLVEMWFKGFVITSTMILWDRPIDFDLRFDVELIYDSTNHYFSVGIEGGFEIVGPREQYGQFYVFWNGEKMNQCTKKIFSLKCVLRFAMLFVNSL